MKYYLDTEFHEYQRKFWFYKPARTIELISIGIVAEDGREYYAISKDFDLKAGWNSYQEEVNMNYRPSFGGGQDGHYNPKIIRTYWLRKNVLKKLGCDIVNFEQFKMFIEHIGKSNSQIANEVKEFVYRTNDNIHPDTVLNFDEMIKIRPIEFYAYYADYDWVVFCWLFGRMIDLPKGFPMYCKDLKQISDELYLTKKKSYFEDNEEKANKSAAFLNSLSDHLDYPKQTNEHNALADAKWNLRLHKFLTNI